MFCGRCGVQLPDEARFCEQCGSQVALGSQEVPLRLRGRRRRRAAIIVVSLLATAVLATAMSIWLRDGKGSSKRGPVDGVSGKTEHADRRFQICPDSSTRLLTQGDLKGRSADDIDHMRNEIYARHGWVFDRPQLQRWFNSIPWYHRARSNKEAASRMTELEKRNAEFILKYLRGTGYRTR